MEIKTTEIKTTEMVRENKPDLAYQKAKKRVKEIKNYYYTLIGYLLIVGISVYKNYNQTIWGTNRQYFFWMLSMWGIFILGYGIYLFVPKFRNWEEEKIKELMDKYLKNKN